MPFVLSKRKQKNCSFCPVDSSIHGPSAFVRILFASYIMIISTWTMPQTQCIKNHRVVSSGLLAPLAELAPWLLHICLLHILSLHLPSLFVYPHRVNLEQSIKYLEMYVQYFSVLCFMTYWGSAIVVDGLHHSYYGIFLRGSDPNPSSCMLIFTTQAVLYLVWHVLQKTIHPAQPWIVSPRVMQIGLCAYALCVVPMVWMQSDYHFQCPDSLPVNNNGKTVGIWIQMYIATLVCDLSLVVSQCWIRIYPVFLSSMYFMLGFQEEGGT